MTKHTSNVDRSREWADLKERYLRPPSQRPTSSARGLHHFALLCNNVEETIIFYQDLLEMPLVELFENRDYQGSTHFFFDVGHGNHLAYFDFPGLYGGEYQEVIGGLHHIALSVEKSKWDRLVAKLETAGIEIQIVNDSSAYFAGPNGERLELLTYPLNDMYGNVIGAPAVDLITTLRSTGAVRQFTDEGVSDDVLFRILDSARFAPNGGNRQAWKVIAVKDKTLRTTLADLYAGPWAQYQALGAAGLTPWSPYGDRTAENEIIAEHERNAGSAQTTDEFVNALFNAPIVLAIVADLENLVATDRDLDRPTMAVGASIYPFAGNILLAARAEGLGGVITTMHVRIEPEVKNLLAIPDHFALAAVIVIGHPEQTISKLRRGAVDSFTTVDRFTGSALVELPNTHRTQP